MLCLLAKTMCGRIQLTMTRAYPGEGAGVLTPAPWKITNTKGLYRNMQLDPPPPWKSWTSWKCWTVLLHVLSESFNLMIVFFEKAMITGLPLQSKLKTCKKRRKKNNVRAFFSQSGLDPAPTEKPDENFLDPRMDIRYRGGTCRETISLFKTFDSAAKI